jgi:hypothetical protein
LLLLLAARRQRSKLPPTEDAREFWFSIEELVEVLPDDGGFMKRVHEEVVDDDDLDANYINVGDPHDEYIDVLFDSSNNLPEPDAKTAPQPEEVWVGKAVISRRFGVSIRTIESWMRQGLPHSRPSPRMVRFWPKECDEWYREQFLNAARPSNYRPRNRR